MVKETDVLGRDQWLMDLMESEGGPIHPQASGLRKSPEMPKMGLTVQMNLGLTKGQEIGRYTIDLPKDPSSIRNLGLIIRRRVAKVPFRRR